jgi:hypothetical protein
MTWMGRSRTRTSVVSLRLVHLRLQSCRLDRPGRVPLHTESHPQRAEAALPLQFLERAIELELEIVSAARKDEVA